MFVSGQSTNTAAKVSAAGSCISRVSEMLLRRPNQGMNFMARSLLSLSLLRFLPWKLNVHTSWYMLSDAEQSDRCFGFSRNEALLECTGFIAQQILPSHVVAQ